MISSASHTPGHSRPDLVAAAGPKPAQAASAPAASATAQESLSASNTETLRNALAATPEIRPEVVEKGRQLATDSNYPPRMIIEKLAELIAKSTDLTNQS